MCGRRKPKFFVYLYTLRFLFPNSLFEHSFSIRSLHAKLERMLTVLSPAQHQSIF